MTDVVSGDVWRDETPHVLAALLRRSGDFEACEDAVQEALLAAARQWTDEGVPDHPRAWLIRVASRRFIDEQRRQSARVRRELKLGAQAPAEAILVPGVGEEVGTVTGDDTLRLLMLCAHPALSDASRVALTLRSVAGLTTEEQSLTAIADCGPAEDWADWADAGR